MTMLSRIWCWLRRTHSNPRLFATDTTIGKETWVCRDCLTIWSEYNHTGREPIIGTPARR